MIDKPDPNIERFNLDVVTNAGYLYTTNARLSSYLANRRLTEATLAIADFRGKRVLDMGCGDGTYTIELFDLGQPASIHGVDSAQEAIRIAQRKIGGRQITFAAQSAYKLPYEANSFDLVYLRGVLHHMDRPVDALKEGLRVAQTLVIIEPNGYNPLLKLLERYSRYHVEHKEKSYAPASLNKWINQLGGRVQACQYAGLVPMFCPNWLARSLKLIEPVGERLPLLNLIGCAVYVFRAVRQ